MNTSDIEVICKIINNVQTYGLKRFDRMDVKFNAPLLNIGKKNVLGKYFRYFVLLIDECFPYFTRRILKSKKSYMPTTFSFLIESYLLIEQLRIDVGQNLTAVQLAEQCADIYLNIDEDGYWWDLPIIPYFDVAIGQEKKRKTMHIHGLARICMAYIKLYREYGNKTFLDIAVNSIYTTIKTHNIRTYKDGTSSISYYPYTDDCTLNICSEFCQWLAMVIRETERTDLRLLLKSMVQLLINEQGLDGSFGYCGKIDELSQGVNKVDCHHTGTVLRNLVEIVQEKVLEKSQEDEVINAIERGTNFYIDKYFDNTDRSHKTGKRGSPVLGPTQYGEAVMALCATLKLSERISKQLRERIVRILPPVIDAMKSLVIDENGSCPSEKVVVWQNINSIRWGNGPVLEALLYYQEICEGEGLVENKTESC